MKKLHLTLVALMVSLYSFAIGPITGTATVCTGAYTFLSDVTAGGTWSSTSTGIATIGSSSGVVTGIAAGTTTISYTVGGTSVTYGVTVNPSPAPIDGGTIPTICTSGSGTVTDASGGGVWSTSYPSSLLTIGSASGVVTAGTTVSEPIVTYTLPDGCIATDSIIISSGPAPITGGGTICSGYAVTLSTTTPGVTWSSSATSIATVGATSGIVVGLSAGTCTITCGGTGCGSFVTTTIIVAPLPSAISGSSTVCVGGTTPWTDATGGGTWASSNPAIASVTSAGVITGNSAGTTLITYGLTTGCYSIKTITVTAGPAAITGTTAVCVGSTATFSDASGGGTWTSSTAGVATVGISTGLVTGIAAGTATVTYGLTSGCYVTAVVTVTAAASAGTISGASAVCIGASTTLTDGVSGGVWSSSGSAATIGASSGVVTGVSAGSVTVTYTVSTCGGASVTYPITVDAAPAAITGGAASICVGATTTFADATTGGDWTSSAPTVASIGITSGVLTGYAAGAVTITYSTGTGCVGTALITITPAPSAIAGTTTICAGTTTVLTDAVAGGICSSSSTSVAAVGTATGVLTGVAAGTATISYSVSTGCSATAVVTVLAAPVIGASATPSTTCGGRYTLTATGGITYSWLPTTGLSCPTCSVTVLTPTGSGTYTVSGTNTAGCRSYATVAISADRVFGHISFSSTAPDTETCKVWLIQFNPIDTSLTALDSTTTCMDGGLPYYEFSGAASGAYMVKAKLIYGNPVGSSGYVPTYSSSTPHWYDAATVVHASGADSLHITMVSGTVPSGPGFIGGLISSGAGRGTSGIVPAVGMLVLLQDATGTTLTYTYTDATGAYGFSGLGNGSYIVYPEAYVYNTIHSAVITLSGSSDMATGVNFIQHTTSLTITPYSNEGVSQVAVNEGINVFPNPTTGNLNIKWANQQTGIAKVTVTDVTGREVYNNTININAASGQTQLGLDNLNNGLYIISIKSGSISYTGKLEIQK